MTLELAPSIALRCTVVGIEVFDGYEGGWGLRTARKHLDVMWQESVLEADDPIHKHGDFHWQLNEMFFYQET